MEALRAILGAAALALAWLSVGDRLGRRFWFDRPASVQLAGNLALGNLVFVALALMLSLIRELHQGPLVALTLLSLTAIQPRRHLGLLRELRMDRFVFLVLAVSFLGALAPSTNFDTQIYHYVLPRDYLAHGSMYWTGTGVYDGTFHFYHLTVAWAFALGGDVCANLLGPLYLALLGLAMASACALYDPKAIPFGWLALISAPVLYLQSFGGLPELPATAFSTLALVFWIYAVRENRAGDWGWAALWVGVSVSTRINALPAVASLSLATWWLVWRGNPGGWRQGFKPLVATLILCAPWLTFNYLNRGFPFYPLGVRWKVQAFRAVPSTQAAPLEPFSPPPTRWEWPVKTSYPASLVVPLAPSANDRSWQDAFSPLLLGGLLLYIASRRPHVHREMEIPALLYLVLTLPLHLVESRYALQGSVWLLAPAALGWSRIQGRLERVVFCCALLAGGTPGLASCWPRVRVVLGLESRSAYLKARVSPYESYEWLAGTNYRHVLLTDMRSFYCPKESYDYLQSDLEREARPNSEDSLEGLRQAIESKKCDLVIWTLLSSLDRRVTHNGDFDAPEDEPLQVWLDRNPDAYFREMRLRVLYHLVHGAKVVYRGHGVIAVEWPRRTGATGSR